MRFFFEIFFSKILRENLQFGYGCKIINVPQKRLGKVAMNHKLVAFELKIDLFLIKLEPFGRIPHKIPCWLGLTLSFLQIRRISLLYNCSRFCNLCRYGSAAAVEIKQQRSLLCQVKIMSIHNYTIVPVLVILTQITQTSKPYSWV